MEIDNICLLSSDTSHRWIPHHHDNEWIYQICRLCRQHRKIKIPSALSAEVWTQEEIDRAKAEAQKASWWWKESTDGN